MTRVGWGYLFPEFAMHRDPDPRLVEMWRQIGEAIASGEIQGIFVVWEQEGQPTHGCGCRSADPIALLEEVKRQAIRVRSRDLH
jgi:hypothetical protein